MLGGRPHWSLQARDTLQYLSEDDIWLDVPIVEDDQPERPDLAELSRKTEEIQQWVKDNAEEIEQAMKNAKDSSI